jgi:hypothetical protein
MPALRDPGREVGPVAEQSAVQQAFRRGGGTGLRECVGATGGATNGPGGEYGILQHANDAIDEVRRAEFFRHGKKKRDLIKGKKWLLMSRWKNLTSVQRGELNRLFQLNRRVFKAYLLKENLERLWDYR